MWEKFKTKEQVLIYLKKPGGKINDHPHSPSNLQYKKWAILCVLVTEDFLQNNFYEKLIQSEFCLHLENDTNTISLSKKTPKR